MAKLQKMPALDIKTDDLLLFGKKWNELGRRLSRTPPYSSFNLGELFDSEVGRVLAKMLGDIEIVKPISTSLLPPIPNCVEVGPCRVVGGIRPQNFDVGYRPDGIRFAFDSKTLNDAKSVRKNYQNMINDLGTEAATVHTRFPFAVVAFIIIIPVPAIQTPQLEALTETLERLTERDSPIDSMHKAEVISFVLWHPDTGEIHPSIPEPNSPLRIETFSRQVEKVYRERYKGLPPHNVY